MLPIFTWNNDSHSKNCKKLKINWRASSWNYCYIILFLYKRDTGPRPNFSQTQNLKFLNFRKFANRRIDKLRFVKCLVGSAWHQKLTIDASVGHDPVRVATVNGPGVDGVLVVEGIAVAQLKNKKQSVNIMTKWICICKATPAYPVTILEPQKQRLRTTRILPISGFGKRSVGRATWAKESMLYALIWG